jgi:hypothetical protein
MAAAVSRIPWAEDEPVGLERVEQAHEIARIDPQRGSQVLLGQRSRMLQVMEGGELVRSHVERGKRLPEPVASHAGEAEDQDTPTGLAGIAGLAGDSGCRSCAHLAQGILAHNRMCA